MIRELTAVEHSGFRWIDAVDPTREELESLAGEHGLSGFAVQDAMNPEHLPKFEAMDGSVFIVVRGYDPVCASESGTVQELTRKVAIYARDALLITIRRTDQPYIAAVVQRWLGKARKLRGDGFPREPLLELIHAAIGSYGTAIDQLSERIEEAESSIFLKQRATGRGLRALYLARRRGSVFKRMIHLTIDVLSKLRAHGDWRDSHSQDVREDAEQTLFWSDELLEDIDSLLGIQLSLASLRTNEVMRVLTLLGAFFLPLTFIVGVYGMNFRHMPELEWEYGYYAILAFMAVVSLGIWTWFRRRGWMK
jgi:magnesium transporter